MIWLGSEPSHSLLENLDGFRRLNPGWEVRLWREEDLDWLANQNLFDSAPTFAGRSNIARYEIVHRFGGYYFDADFEPRLPLESHVPTAGLVTAPERMDFYNQGFFGAPADHEFLLRLIKDLPASIANNATGSSQVVSGPVFFTRELEAWRCTPGNTSTDVSRDLLYPYSYDHLERADGPFAPEVVAVHRWDQARRPRVYVDGKRRRDESLTFRLLSVVRPRARIEMAWGLVGRATWKPQALAIDELRAVTVTKDGQPLIFNLSDLNTLGYLYADGEYDRGFHKFLAKILSGSDVYVDVGANIGQFVLAAAQQLSPYGRVFAFEPNPVVAETLKRNVYLHNNSGRVVSEIGVKQLAVSDRIGTASLRIPTMHDGRASTSPEALRDLPETAIEATQVEQSTLDRELGFLSHIRLLKVDVEGSEPMVLAGARELIDSGRVDFLDLESQRSHLGSNIDVLSHQLGRMQTRGAKFYELSPRGTTREVGGSAGNFIRERDFGHLIVDLRPLRRALPTQDD